jgi:hypothetical protein
MMSWYNYTGVGIGPRRESRPLHYWQASKASKGLPTNVIQVRHLCNVNEHVSESGYQQTFKEENSMPMLWLLKSAIAPSPGSVGQSAKR